LLCNIRDRGSLQNSRAGVNVGDLTFLLTHR
jgi:hypothetical protein